MSLLPFFQWCNGTTLGMWVRGSIYPFPVIETFHILALSVLGGTVLVVDMRLLRLGLQEPVRRMAREVEPWMVGALVVIIASGILLFLSEAIKCYDNLAFWVKITALFLAILFTFTIRRRVAMSDGPPSPTRDRCVAVTSIVLWSAVGFMGRGIGFY